MAEKRTARRDRGNGCIRHRKDGRWEGRYFQEMQQAIYVYGKTKKDVQDKLFALHREPNIVRDPERLTVGEWIARWLQSVNDDPNVRLATYKLYKSAVDLHINPYIQDIQLVRLSKSDVYALLDSLATKGVGGRMRQVVHSTLHRALQVALRRDKVARNVVALVDKPSASKKEKIILRTVEEIFKFRKAAGTSRYCALYLTALDTGLRQGELLALTWDCVDLVRGYLSVRATLTENQAGKLVLAPPKTNSSVRIVKLAKSTVELLRDSRKRQMASNSGLSKWVFPNLEGGPTRKDGYIRSEFRRVAKAAGIPGLSFHGLRHSHATMLAGLGVNVKALQERLGHRTARMTLDVYSHATATLQDQAVATLDNFYDNAVSGQISGQTAKRGIGEAN